MASIILGAVGAGIGSAFGGPAGARLGFSIGATLGGFLDTPKAQNSESGKLDDLKVTASAYGTAIPQIWGGMATGGNIIWATNLKEHKHKQKQGGKGGGGATSTTYTYSVSLAVLVCAGRPGLTVSRIQANDLVIWEAGKSSNVITPRFYDGSQTAADPLIQSIEGTAPCYAGLNLFVLEDLDLSKFGNSIPQLKIETAQGGVTVGSVLSDVSLLAGLTAADFDFSAATKPVAGFIINNRTAARDSLKPLLSWALTDLVETGGAMTAVPRGGAPVLTVSLDDLGASTSGAADLLTESRTQDVELPWRVDCKYFSAQPGKHYEQGSQGAIRIGAPQQQALSLDLPLALLDADARACAEQQLQQAWVERSPVTLLLPPRYLTVAPASLIGTTVQVKCVSDYQALADVAAQSVTIATPGPTAAQVAEKGLQTQIDALTTAPGFTPAAPVTPTGISQIPTYVGSVLYLEAVPAFSGVDPSPSAPFPHWRKSTDGGASWFGNDGTAATTYPGHVMQHSLTAGTIRFQVRTENALGVPSGWYTQGADTVYAAPPAVVKTVAGRTGDVTLAAADISGLGTAAVANLPTAGSNAAAAQVVRGDDTRLGTGGGGGGAIIIPSSFAQVLSVAAGYQIAPSSGLFLPAYLLTDGASGDTASGYKGKSAATFPAVKPADTSGVVASYLFNDGNGTVIRDSIGTNNAAVTAAGTVASFGTDPNGDAGWSPNGTGNQTGAYALTPAGLLANGSFSVEALFYNTATTQNQQGASYDITSIVAPSGALAGFDLRFGFNSSAQAYYSFYMPNTSDTNNDCAANIDTTASFAKMTGVHHLLASYNAGTNLMSLYLDGALLATKTFSGTAKSFSGQRITLGGAYYSGFSGGFGNYLSSGTKILYARYYNADVSATASARFAALYPASLTALLDIGPQGILPINSVTVTRAWANALGEALEYSVDGAAWTNVPTGYVGAAHGGVLSSAQTTITPGAAINARYTRYSLKDTASTGSACQLTDFRLA